uniref:(northern house mosquito) hypothetical protein n=1 Tax=Culex pipiens TaxID=7175 RepID=A0A8D8A2L8_CULPI
MTRRKRIKLKKVEWRRVEWQGEEYDADCSDDEGLAEMPSPVGSNHPNYPLEELEKDVDFNLEFLRELRAEGTLLPEDVVKVKRIMQLFRRDLSIVLEAANTRYLPVAATCEFREPEPEPKTERPPQPAAGSARSKGKLSPGKVGGKKLKKKQSRSSPDSGNESSPKSRPRSVKFKKNQGLESSRSSDSAMGSSARNLPKPTKSSQVKHKAKHKFKEFEHEIRKIQTSVITLLNGNGNELETEIDPDLEEIVGLISEMRKKDPDLPIEERLCEYFNKFY